MLPLAGVCPQGSSVFVCARVCACVWAHVSVTVRTHQCLSLCVVCVSACVCCMYNCHLCVDLVPW